MFQNVHYQKLSYKLPKQNVAAQIRVTTFFLVYVVFSIFACRASLYLRKNTS